MPDIVVRRLSAIFLAVFSIFVVWYFHDRTWWAPDEGAYAHIAERLLNGEVLNGSVSDFHVGLFHFLHAAVFEVFGVTMVVLRYPLMLFTVLQSLLILWLLRDRDWFCAMAGGVAMTALTFVQFLHPNGNWYALFATVLLIAAVAWIPKDMRGRYFLLGALAMIVIMFRQLTGGFVLIGLVTWLLTEEMQRQDDGPPVLARAILVLCALVIGLYLLMDASPTSFILFGIWPLGLIAVVWRNTAMADRRVAIMVVQLVAGAFAMLAPLVLYHLLHGSFATWIDDTVWSAFRLANLPSFDRASYLYLPLIALGQAVRTMAFVPFLNGLFWVVLLAAPLALGCMVIGRAWRARRGVPFLAHIAVFFALVPVFHEIPIYLLHSTALTLCGLLAVSDRWGKRRRAAISVAILLLAGVGLWFQAGQPVSRGLVAIATGERQAVRATAIGYRVGLRITPAEHAFYDWLVPLIKKNSRPDESILTLPSQPELYFMTGRRNPTRFFNSAVGLFDEGNVLALLATLAKDPPAVVVFNSHDKYVTPPAEKVMTRVRATYRRIAQRDGVEVYIRRK